MTDGFDAETRRMMRSIEANWDARTPVHVASEFYGVDRRDPGFWFADFEWGDLGDLDGRDVLHLQCHLGTETAAFARRGARAVGLDLSGAAVVQARQLAQRKGLPIEYVHANVFDAVGALGGRRFDVVYTGKGALVYVPDLDRWAGVVAELLRPGGQLYVVEFHPVLASLGLVPDPAEGETLTLRYDYLPGRGPVEINSPYLSTRWLAPGCELPRCARARWRRGRAGPGWSPPSVAGSDCPTRNRRYRCCTRCARSPRPARSADRGG